MVGQLTPHREKIERNGGMEEWKGARVPKIPKDQPLVIYFI